MRGVKASYKVNLPSVASGTYSFSFTSDVPNVGRIGFTFRFLNNQWNGWAALPSGEVRQFGCIPDVIDWTAFSDYGIVLDSSLPSLGLNDMGSASMFLIVWAAN